MASWLSSPSRCAWPLRRRRNCSWKPAPPAARPLSDVDNIRIKERERRREKPFKKLLPFTRIANYRRPVREAVERKETAADIRCGRTAAAMQCQG